MNIKNTALKRRIIELSFKHKLSHLGSCITAVDIIDEIYSKKKPGEKFVLSSGHAGLALYVVLEKYQGLDAEKLLEQCGIHPDRVASRQYYEFGYSEPIDCSTGSLGQGLPIAVGMALADRSKNVYCLISDGEASEGSIYEALNIKTWQKLNNLKVYLNYNGWGAYRRTIIDPFFRDKGTEIIRTDSSYLSFLSELNAHYHVMNEEEYQIAQNILG